MVEIIEPLEAEHKQRIYEALRREIKVQDVHLQFMFNGVIDWGWVSEDFCFFYRPGSLLALYASPHQEFPTFLRQFGSRHGIHVELRELDPARFETYSAYRQ
jgi:hypothetical protein